MNMPLLVTNISIAQDLVVLPSIMSLQKDPIVQKRRPLEKRRPPDRVRGKGFFILKFSNEANFPSNHRTGHVAIFFYLSSSWFWDG